MINNILKWHLKFGLSSYLSFFKLLTVFSIKSKTATPNSVGELKVFENVANQTSSMRESLIAS